MFEMRYAIRASDSSGLFLAALYATRPVFTPIKRDACSYASYEQANRTASVLRSVGYAPLIEEVGF